MRRPGIQACQPSYLSCMPAHTITAEQHNRLASSASRFKAVSTVANLVIVCSLVQSTFVAIVSRVRFIDPLTGALADPGALTSDENRKPNVCRACGSRFGRSDVLRRHTKKCVEYQGLAQGVHHTSYESEQGGPQRRQGTWQVAAPAEGLDTMGQIFDSPRSGNGLLPPETGAEAEQPLMGPSSMAALPETPSVPTAMQELLGTGDFDDLGFLEDFLLPDTSMIPGNIASMAYEDECMPGLPSWDNIGLGSHPSRVTLPTFQTTVSNVRGKLSEPSYFQVLSTNNYEVEEFRKQLYCTCPHDLLRSFRFPSRSRIVRCIVAYFDHFDPHTPIIQHAKFSLCGTHPALVLIILAIGAMYLSEYDFSVPAYKVACSLLEAYTIEERKQTPSQFEFAPLQAMLLCVQFSTFSGEEMYSRTSERQFSVVCEALKNGLDTLKAERSKADQNWDQWSFVETFSRLATWTCTLSAILLANDPTSSYMAPYQLREVPLPFGEELWRAQSATQWAVAAERVKFHGDSNLSDVAEALLRGGPIPENLSSFALLSLAGWALTYICTQERLAMSLGPVDLFNSDFRAKMERVLSEWAMYTLRRMRADRVIYRGNDPLFTDCFPLLASSYYHLYLGEELRALKEKAAKDDALPAGVKGANHLPPITSLRLAHKGILYAANSWFVRAKLGMGHFKDTAAINYGGHYLMTAYETALILSWWLSLNNSPEHQDSKGDYAAVMRSIGEILSEAFAEVEDQGIPCGDAASRALGPLLFAQRCMSQSVYPYRKQSTPHVGTAIGDHVIDVRLLVEHGVFDGADVADLTDIKSALSSHTLNLLASLPYDSSMTMHLQPAPEGQPRYSFSTSARFDFELEMGVIMSGPIPRGQVITADQANEFIFGFVLLNDWSARDIQFAEMTGMGPYNGKSTATTISPWVVLSQALEEARCESTSEKAQGLMSSHPAHLQHSVGDSVTWNIELQASIANRNGPPTIVCKSNLRDLFWTPGQMLAHMTSSGSGGVVGDLFGTGTVSSPGHTTENPTLGCLFELTDGGKTPLKLKDGREIVWLEDYDEVILTGWAMGKGAKRIGFGEARGMLIPAE
ncbi:hypothetical protein G7Z17_g9779 [Cylindrodendrum hubeiense]|uniref:fumarylacetoacetase n=1 Tax=Cylindrodendrum hubeiense TaxID=595255 RepID=A0A9P5H8H8_9HYPO|nr:hypothetical protein G7Z17_g9779 [Cylindrodendrum hubeiense]